MARGVGRADEPSLPFYWEQRGDSLVIADYEGGCHPASDHEKLLIEFIEKRFAVLGHEARRRGLVTWEDE